MRNCWKGVAAGALLAGLVVGSEARTGPNGELTADNFASLRNLIRPQTGESRWLEIPWLLDLHEARRQAAAAGKPLFVYSGGGATGIGAC